MKGLLVNDYLVNLKSKIVNLQSKIMKGLMVNG